MKLFLIILSLIFLNNFSLPREEFSFDNIFTQATSDLEFNVLRPKNNQFSREYLGLNYEPNIMTLTCALPKKGDGLKIFANVNYLILSKQTLKWGPLSLPNPPPFVSA